MIDVFLAYPPLSLQERYGQRNVGENYGQQPPLGLALLAAYIRQKGFTVKIIDAQAENLTAEDLVLRVCQENPRIIGISALTSIFYRAAACAEALRLKLPDTLLIIGGHHASILPEQTMRDFSCFDILCKGEGEETLTEILLRYKEKHFCRKAFLSDFSVLRQIKGIAYRDDASIHFTESRPLIADINSLPIPARDLLPIESYIPLPNQYKRLPLLNMTISRGCPYSCSYCSAASVFGRGMRMRSPEKTIDEIETLISNYGAREISFWDDTLTMNKKWLHTFCSIIVERKLDITWTCYSRVDSISLPMLRMMKSAGCWNIFFGFESGDQRILDLIGKGITLEQIRMVCKWCKEVGIEIRASFMLALPTETPELAKKTIAFAVEVDPDYAQFCITTPFPGTKLYEEAEQYGTIDKDFSKYTVWEPVFLPRGYRSHKEIMEIERMAMRRFYLRPRYVFNKIKKINSVQDLLRYLKGLRLLSGFLRNVDQA